MAIDFSFSNGKPLELRPGIPESYRGPVLRGATGAWAETDAINLVVQEMDAGDWSIRFSFVQFFKRVGLTGFLRSAGLYSYFMLQNGLREEIAAMGKFHLRQGQYFSFFSLPCSYRFRNDEGRELRSLDIFYSPRLLEELFPYFPELIELVGRGGSELISLKPRWALPSMSEIAHQILHCPYDVQTCEFYFDLKVRELLFQVLEHTYKIKMTERNYTPWEVKKIHAVRDILERHVRGKPPRLRELSREVGLNEFKLKAGFRQYFNAGIFEWLWERKMQYARDLILQSNAPVKEVGAAVGYPLTTNFITAFRRRFGISPGALRRK